MTPWCIVDAVNAWEFCSIYFDRYFFCGICLFPRQNKAELQPVIQPLSCILLHLLILIYFLHFQIPKIQVQHVLHLIHRPEFSQHMHILNLFLQVVDQWKHAPGLWRDHILIKFQQIAHQGFLEVKLRMSSQTRATKVTQLYSRGLLDFKTTKWFQKHLKILLCVYRVYSPTIAGAFFNVCNVIQASRSSEHPMIGYRKSWFLSIWFLFHKNSNISCSSSSPPIQWDVP